MAARTHARNTTSLTHAITATHPGHEEQRLDAAEARRVEAAVHREVVPDAVIIIRSRARAVQQQHAQHTVIPLIT